MKYCPKCGKPVNDDINFCPACGANINNSAESREDDTTKVVHIPAPNTSDKNRLVALLLDLFLGCLGIHRFYVGKIGTGILYLFTCGIFGIGAFVDLILILVGSFTDSAGKPVTNWGD